MPGKRQLCPWTVCLVNTWTCITYKYLHFSVSSRQWDQSINQNIFCKTCPAEVFECPLLCLVDSPPDNEAWQPFFLFFLFFYFFFEFCCCGKHDVCSREPQDDSSFTVWNSSEIRLALQDVTVPLSQRGSHILARSLHGPSGSLKALFLCLDFSLWKSVWGWGL